MFFYAAYARTGADGPNTERTGWCPHYESGSRLLSDVLKTGEDNETALRRSSLWISYGGVVNRVGVCRVEDCFPGPRAALASRLVMHVRIIVAVFRITITTAKLRYSIPYSISLARHLITGKFQSSEEAGLACHHAPLRPL